MEERIYARGEYEESKDELNTLRYEYRAIGQECQKGIAVCEVGDDSLFYDDLGTPKEVISLIEKMSNLKPKITTLQKKVKLLKDKWNF